MDEQFIINGGRKLEGKIIVCNAKNAALKILAASILTSKPIKVANLPQIEDISRMKELLIDLGAKFYSDTFDCSCLKKTDLNYKIADRFRASIVLTGPLLARFGKVSFPHPGGCTLGKRPIDLFIEGFKALGASIKKSGPIFTAISKNKKLIGNKFIFPTVSVTGTETLMMAAALAEGKTILKNAACEPEVEILAKFLNSLGAKISGAGTPIIVIKGVKSLKGGEWGGMPDRIEAGTYMIAAVMTGGKLTIRNAKLEHNLALVDKLHECGGVVEEKGEGTEVFRKGRRTKPTDITTLTYPGFPTDMQPQAMSMLALADGTSVISENIFENRFIHVSELKRMGADINIEGHSAIVTGKDFLTGCPVKIPDLRAGAALVLAGLAAKGQTMLYGSEHIERGYEKITEKLHKLGARIERV